MRATVQRVARASVRVEGETVGEIGPGLLALVGVADGDGPDEIALLADKICNLRIFEDDRDHMNRSLLDAGGAVLAVSQFTLFADCRRGRRPSFTGAARPEVARDLFDAFVEALRTRGPRVETGVFQAMMEVDLVNDGPVTINLDTDHLRRGRGDA